MIFIIMLDKYTNNLKNILSLPIYCINLPYRNDRWKLLENQYLKFTNTIYRIYSVNHSNNIVSCALSFLKCILLAKKGNYKQILICEDDVTFHKNSILYWNLSIKELPNDWDILLGGLSNFDDVTCKKENYRNLVKINDFSGEHMMLVNKKAYNILLTYIDNLQKTKKYIHFDRFLGNLAKLNKLNIYCCVPFVSIPLLQDYSNIRNKYVNDLQYFAMSADKLNKLVKKN